MNLKKSFWIEISAVTKLPGWVFFCMIFEPFIIYPCDTRSLPHLPLWHQDPYLSPFVISVLFLISPCDTRALTHLSLWYQGPSWSLLVISGPFLISPCHTRALPHIPLWYQDPSYLSLWTRAILHLSLWYQESSLYQGPTSLISPCNIRALPWELVLFFVNVSLLSF